MQATVAVTLAVDPRRGGGELALALGLGVDAERLRDRIQNGFHDLIGDKRIPLVDRPDRLYGGLSLAYRFGVALRGRGGASLRSPARLVLAGQRP
ncbi:MAG: hypothetical protein KC636_08135 [Myxococcales bacterium]|nr:hypothetical protein [Myxococcales bacterium]